MKLYVNFALVIAHLLLNIHNARSCEKTNVNKNTKIIVRICVKESRICKVAIKLMSCMNETVVKTGFLPNSNTTERCKTLTYDGDSFFPEYKLKHVIVRLQGVCATKQSITKVIIYTGNVRYLFGCAWNHHCTIGNYRKKKVTLEMIQCKTEHNSTVNRSTPHRHTVNRSTPHRHTVNQSTPERHKEFLNSTGKQGTKTAEAYLEGAQIKGPNEPLFRVLRHEVDDIKCNNTYNHPSCDKECKCKNSWACNQTNGLCSDGYCKYPRRISRNQPKVEKDQNCTHVCRDGKFLIGGICRGTCNCVDNNMCRVDDGACGRFGCRKGLTGLHCNKSCNNGTFGRNCEKNCNCYNNELCNKVSGVCPGPCKAGFTGDDCLLVITGAMNPVLVAAITIASIAVLFGIVYFCCKPQSTNDQVFDEENMSMEDDFSQMPEDETYSDSTSMSTNKTHTKKTKKKNKKKKDKKAKKKKKKKKKKTKKSASRESVAEPAPNVPKRTLSFNEVVQSWAFDKEEGGEQK